MSKEIVMFGLAGALLFSGHMPEMHGSLTRKSPEPPSWLSIPAEANIARIDYTGPTGNKKSRGTVHLRVDKDTPEVLSRVAGALATEGFLLQDAGPKKSHSMIQTSYMSANNPATGRSALILLKPARFGSETRITYNDPS